MTETSSAGNEIDLDNAVMAEFENKKFLVAPVHASQMNTKSNSGIKTLTYYNDIIDQSDPNVKVGSFLEFDVDLSTKNIKTIRLSSSGEQLSMDMNTGLLTDNMTTDPGMTTNGISVWIK